MPRSPVKQLPYSDIFDQIMEGFDQQLATFFTGRTTTVVPLTGDNALSEAAKKTNREDGFPFFARRYNTIEEIEDQRNGFLLRLDGLAKKDKAGNWFIFRLTPLRISLTLNFLCLDEKDLRIFAQRWTDARKLHYLDFNLVFHDNPLKVRADLDGTITYPDLDTNEDTGQLFNCEITCSLAGYMGSVTPVTTIKEVKVNAYAQGHADPGAPQNLQTRTFVVADDGLYENDIKVANKPKTTELPL